MSLSTHAYAPGATPASAAMPVHEPGARQGLADVIELFPGSGTGRRQSTPEADPAWPRASAADEAARARASLRVSLRGLRRARRRWAVRLQLIRLWLGGRATGQHGMATAEYAIATLGAVAFAGLLVVIMRSDEVRGFLLDIIRAALAMP